VFKFGVVGVSSGTYEGAGPTQICEFYKFRIAEDYQQCAALNDGRNRT